MLDRTLGCRDLQEEECMCDPTNYRGVHLTSQLARVIERLIQMLCRPALMSEISIGANQFAYCQGRGSRDALAFLVLSWLKAFQEKARVALYMSDVSAAFDRVFTPRMIEKLRSKGVPSKLLDVFMSWLRERTAEVVVNGCSSEQLSLKNMVFQGTVLGPMLWNSFYNDASVP